MCNVKSARPLIPPPPHPSAAHPIIPFFSFLLEFSAPRNHSKRSREKFVVSALKGKKEEAKKTPKFRLAVCVCAFRVLHHPIHLHTLTNTHTHSHSIYAKELRCVECATHTKRRSKERILFLCDTHSHIYIYIQNRKQRAFPHRSTTVIIIIIGTQQLSYLATRITQHRYRTLNSAAQHTSSENAASTHNQSFPIYYR